VALVSPTRKAGGPRVRLAIEQLAAGGAGVGHDAEGRVLFVQRTAPGDLVEAVVTEHRKRWGRARLLRVIEPGAGRRLAPCPLYERCGGCTLEHLEYEAQLAAKRRIAADALARIGGIPLPGSFPITGSPEQFRYRNRVTFHLRRLGRGAIAGFHELERPAHVLDVDERCLLPEPVLAAAWGVLRRKWGPAASLLPAGGSLRLTLRANLAGRVTLLVVGGRGRGEPEEILRRVPALAAIWHAREPGAEPVLAAGEAGIAETWGDESVELSGNVFLQVNRSAAALLEEHVLGLAGAVAGKRVVDSYCGVGLHARRLARAGALVIGLELDARAIRQARLGAPPGAEFRQGLVEVLLPAALPADLVILNPPRTGAHAAVPEALLSRPPERIIYISCDPATLARDLARLAGRCVLRSLHCFDLFPQTAHVETVAELACSTT
jgi:tRNA/tmRNA/rRNA uracil-C5-methylase (TrmA/RlmC/RlmD family)